MRPLRGAVKSGSGVSAKDYVDKSDSCFKDNQLTEAQRHHVLEFNDQNAIMDVFYQSQFYQTESNNEEIRQQYAT